MKLDEEAFGMEDAVGYVLQFLCSSLEAVILTV